MFRSTATTRQSARAPAPAVLAGRRAGPPSGPQRRSLAPVMLMMIAVAVVTQSAAGYCCDGRRTEIDCKNDDCLYLVDGDDGPQGGISADAETL